MPPTAISLREILGELGAKRVVMDIVESLDRDSILREARSEILRRLRTPRRSRHRGRLTQACSSSRAVRSMRANAKLIRIELRSPVFRRGQRDPSVYQQFALDIRSPTCCPDDTAPFAERRRVDRD